MAFAFYSPLTVQTGQVPSAQSNFPFLISITDARFKVIGSGGHVQSSSGYDLIPHSNSGLTTRRHFERDLYNSATGQLIMWALDASIADGNVTYLGYGDASITTDQQDASNVWDTNFQAVYHLGDGSSLSLADSTTNARTLTNTNGTAAAGQVNGAVNFNVFSGTKSLSTGSAVNGMSDLTFSCWINTSNGNANGFDGVVGGLNGDAGPLNRLLIPVASNKLVAQDSSGTNTTSTSTVGVNVWVHVAVSVTSSVPRLYINGALDATGAAGNWASGAGVTYFGNGSPPNAYGMGGSLDEPRLSSTARSTNWLATEYNNQHAPGSFLSLGTEAAVSGAIAAILLRNDLAGDMHR